MGTKGLLKPLASRKDPEFKPGRTPEPARPEPTISEAAEKAGLVIRRLQSKLRERGPGPDLGREPASSGPRNEDLDQELENYFHHVAMKRNPEAGALDALRSQVVDQVVDRILREWDAPADPHSPSLEREVMERLVERLLERLSS